MLQRHGRPALPWSLKARLMGVPGSSNGDVFHGWARLPIAREQFRREQEAEQEALFPLCEPLPGAARLLATLARLPAVHVALASSSESRNYARKTARPAARDLLALIPAHRRVLADDPRMLALGRGRGKPAPDMFLIALEAINASLPEGQAEIAPAECLVFEDSVPGVEAGRRAGMRVVWVPHPRLAEHMAGREKEVLAGRTGLVPIGDDHQMREIDDGWAEQLRSLEEFDYAKYGIAAVPAEAERVGAA